MYYINRATIVVSRKQKERTVSGKVTSKTWPLIATERLCDYSTGVLLGKRMADCFLSASQQVRTMPEDNQTFLIPGPLGVTQIETSQGQAPYRGTLINGDEIVFGRVSQQHPFQPSLPFPYRLEIASYFEQVEKNLESVLEIIRSVRVRREQLLRFCIQGGQFSVITTPFAWSILG